VFHRAHNIKIASIRMNFRNYFLVFGLICFIGLSCGEGGSTESDSSGSKETASKDGGDGSSLMEIDGKLFSIPSPIQTALLIKDVGSNYNMDLLNRPQNIDLYSTSFSKGINLGIYGADLGYVTIYEQTQDAIGYLTIIKRLAHDLGISGAFDISLLERFEANLGIRDSLLSLVSDAFRASDSYLKNNQRNDIGALVLAGGWVESLYFSCIIAESTHNDDVISRIGNQKSTSNNIIQLLMPYYSKSDYTSFIDQLIELNEVFKSVEVTYEYKEPEVDAANKLTVINSVTDVRITDEQLKDINQKIRIIRDQLIN